MTELSSITLENGLPPRDKVGRLAGFGSIFGIIAAAFGLLIGKTLIPISAIRWEATISPSFSWVIEGDPNYPIYVSIFMGLIAVCLLLQFRGSRELGNFIGSGYVNLFVVGFLVAVAIAYSFPTLFFGVVGQVLIRGFWTPIYFLGTVFVIVWQLVSIIYTDSSKTWIGFVAGMLNALFIPLLALGQALNPILIYAGYGVLLVGQLISLLFWWSPFDTIREYARSPEKAKFAFTLTGFLIFSLGLPAVILGPVVFQQGIGVFAPWSTLISETTYQTNPALIFGLLALMIYWIMLAPRLGARELKAAAIGEDIVKGGSKWFMLFLAIFGLLSAAQAGAFVSGVASWGFFMVIAPAGIMFLMGASYTAKTDIITGMPMVIAAVILLIHPFVILPFILIPWILVILTQLFLMGESWIRGLTGFSQGSLTVIISLAASIIFVLIMLGGLGSGPLALWPVNRWFNITLFPDISTTIQGPFIIVLPLIALIIRNVSLAGYSYGRGYASGGILVGVSVIFAFMIPVIAGNESITHEANTGAALLLALYSIGVALVMSMNLNLANDVEEKGYGFESSLIKVSTITGLLAAAIVAILVMIVFAGMPTPNLIALMVSIMVVFVVGTEILSIIGWFLAGIRLGMLRKGFKFTRLS